MKLEESKIKIRIADKQDWQTIIDIYNQAVDDGDKTADTQSVKLVERKDWLSLHNRGKYPILLAEMDSQIIGWCSLSPHRPGRKALERTAEISYYVSRNFRNMGIGSLLINSAIETARINGIKNLFAILLDINLGSINILKKFQFEQWGHLPNVAEINGNLCGQLIYGKHL